MTLSYQRFHALLSAVIYSNCLSSTTEEHNLPDGAIEVLLAIIELYDKCDAFPSPELVRLQTNYSQEEFAPLFDALLAADFIGTKKDRVAVIAKGLALLDTMAVSCEKEMRFRADHLTASKDTEAIFQKKASRLH